MIRNAIRNFFKNLKYYFTPLGVMFFFFAIACAIIFFHMDAAFTAFFGKIGDVIERAGINAETFQNEFVQEMDKLPPNLYDAVKYILSTDWLENTLNQMFARFTGDAEGYVESVSIATSDLIGQTLASVWILFAFLVSGVVVGYWVTKSLIRREIARRSIWKSILATVIEGVLLAGVASFSTFLFSLWKPGAFITVGVFALLFGFVSLLESYLIHGLKKMRIREVVSVKNLLAMYAGYAIVLVIMSVVYGGIVFLTGKVIGTLIMLPLIEIAMIVNGLNVESYIILLAEENVASRADQKKQEREEISQRS